MKELKEYEEPKMVVKNISFSDVIVTSVSNKTEKPVYIQDNIHGIDDDNPFGS